MIEPLSCKLFPFFYLPDLKNDAAQWKQKVAMLKTHDNEYCQCIQNDTQEYKIKVKRNLFSLSYGVLELLGNFLRRGRNPLGIDRINPI